MNCTLKGIVESLALKVEGKDNPIRMCQLTLAVPTESQHDAEEAAGPRIAAMAYGADVQGDGFRARNRDHVLDFLTEAPGRLRGQRSPRPFVGGRTAP